MRPGVTERGFVRTQCGFGALDRVTECGPESAMSAVRTLDECSSLHLRLSRLTTDAVRVYRICDALYAHAPFSGEGGLYRAGRWHSHGTRIAYASLEQGTAMLEVLMNVGRETLLAAERTLIVATLPDAHVTTLPTPSGPSTGQPTCIRRKRVPWATLG